MAVPGSTFPRPPRAVAACSVFLGTIVPTAAVPHITRRQSSFCCHYHALQCHLQGSCSGGQIEGVTRQGWDNRVLRSSRRPSSYQDIWSRCTLINPGLSTSRVYKHVGHILSLRKATNLLRKFFPRSVVVTASITLSSPARFFHSQVSAFLSLRTYIIRCLQDTAVDTYIHHPLYVQQ